jgi:hypothetical protein
VTGPDVVPEQTVRDLATVLRPLGPLDRVELLTGGMFATTYRATLGDGMRVVVKTAPTDTDRLLRYEHDLLRTEAAVYSLAADRPDLLMPRVLLTDLSRTVLASDVLVVSHLDGVPLVDAGELEPAVSDTVQRQPLRRPVDRRAPRRHRHGTVGVGRPGSSSTACTCPSCCSSRSRRAATWATG